MCWKKVSKEPSAAYTNLDQRGGPKDLPYFILEVGVCERLKQLKMDAEWWIKAERVDDLQVDNTTSLAQLILWFQIFIGRKLQIV